MRCKGSRYCFHEKVYNEQCSMEYFISFINKNNIQCIKKCELCDYISTAMSSMKCPRLSSFFLSSILRANAIINGATTCRERKTEGRNQTRGKRRECNAGFFLLDADDVIDFFFLHATKMRDDEAGGEEKREEIAKKREMMMIGERH